MKLSYLLPFVYILIIGVIWVISISRKKTDRKTNDSDKYNIDVVINELKEYMNNILYLNDKKSRKNKLNERKDLLRGEVRNALRQCSCGDIVAKNYVKEHIKNWLINEYGIDTNNINRIICFSNTRNMKPNDKFDVILYKLKQSHGSDAFSELINRIPGDISVITEKDIEKVYQSCIGHLGYREKLDMVVQRIYQHYKGHGVIDELRDMNIDGISAGVSGLVDADTINKNDVLKNYNSIWVFHRGKMIRLALLGFESEHELERVCKNVYRYSSPGQLSAARGYIANEMKDGSRVVVVRPPFAEGWAFFIRKFGMGMLSNINDLIKDKNAELIIDFLRLLVLSAQVFGITGEQGCGKTTMLKAIISFIPEHYTLRVQELVHELHLREVYPERNIVSFKETSTVEGREGLDIQKKTDGTVSIIGEVASAAVASWLVMASQVASKFTIFTHHAKSTEHLIYSLRNDLMLAGGFTNDMVAEHQVRSAVRFDIHMTRDSNGKRYIERITEILMEGDILINDIIRRDDNGYHVVGAISKDTYCEMYNRLNETDRRRLAAYEKV